MKHAETQLLQVRDPVFLLFPSSITKFYKSFMLLLKKSPLMYQLRYFLSILTVIEAPVYKTLILFSIQNILFNTN